jgi:hypothetical protein
MEPVYYVSYYLELQKQLAASKGSSQKPLLEVPADQELKSLRPGQAIKLWSVLEQSIRPRGSRREPATP